MTDYTSSTFDEAKKALENNVCRIISLEELARSRIQEAREINAYIENKKDTGFSEIKVALQ